MPARRLLPLLLALALVVSLGASALLAVRIGEAERAVESARASATQTEAENERLRTEVGDLEARLAEQRAEAEQLRQQVQELQARLATPVATPTPSAPALSGEERALLSRIERRVSGIRGLQPRNDVGVSVKTPAELRQFLAESFDRDYPPEERATDQKLLVTLGLLRPEQDLAQVLLDLYEEQVVGLYDRDTGRMYVVASDRTIGTLQNVTYAHEFTHALQDQHFDLERIAPRHPENEDQAMAVRALIEGDATLLELQYAAQALSPSELQELSGQGDSSRLAAAPLVIREELLFPYLDGLRFVRTLERAGGWEAVNAAYRNPPASTAQVLHPEKYRAGQAPVAVELPDLAAALGGEWRQIKANTLGELDLRIWIEQFTDNTTATAAASGWAGDRYQLVEDDRGRTLLALRIAWDSSSEAAEFLQAATSAARSRLGPGATEGEVRAGASVVVGSEQAILMARQGQASLVVIGPTEELARRAAAAVGL